MKKSVIIFLHIGFWICYLLLIMIVVGVFYRSNHSSVDQTSKILNAIASVSLFALFPSVITFYFYYFLVFPKYLQHKKHLSAILSALLISLAAAILSYISIRFFIETGRLIDMDDGGRHGRSTALRTILITSIIASISGMVALVIKGFITWFDERKLKEELKQKNHEAELALVKAQLDPHFLFNTLNNIDTLIVNNATDASNYLNMLSDILRFMLYETKSEKILLVHEIECIQKYIELQKIRTSNLNYVHFEISGSPGNKTIAPLVFIPFIENAFKHATNKKIDNAINVKILIDKNSIGFVCENKYDPNRKYKQGSNGLGNDLIQKRLDLIYPGNHKLEIVKHSDIYSVHLTITNG